MSEEEKGSEEADEGTGEAGEGTPADTPEPEKKKVRRKPIWVCVPVEFEEIAEEDDEGNLVSVRQPTKYAIERCEPKKKEVLAVLKRYEIDILNIDTVLMFRADPLKFDVENQLNIRW